MAIAIACAALLWAVGTGLVLTSELLPMEPSEEAAALAADDECDVGGPSGQAFCALEALQLRGRANKTAGVTAALESKGASNGGYYPYNYPSSYSPYRPNSAYAHGPYPPPPDPNAHGPYPPRNPYPPHDPYAHAPYPHYKPHDPYYHAPYPARQPYPPPNPYTHGPYPAPRSMAPGGNCKVTPCAKSRGMTWCGAQTGFKCMCKMNYYASFGRCIYR